MEVRFLAHSNPVWSMRADTIVEARPPEIATDGNWWLEHLPCRSLGDDLFEVCCVPYSIPELALGDTIVAGREEPPALRGLKEHSGRSTLTAHFPQELGAVTVDETSRALAAVGCLLEYYEPFALLAIDAESIEIAQVAFDILYQRKREGKLLYSKTYVPTIAMHAPYPLPPWRRPINNYVHSRADDWPGLEWERLGATTVSENRFVIRDIPFFTYGLALGDEVETTPGPEMMAENIVTGVARPSGCFTFRVSFNRPGDYEPRADLASRLESQGYLVQWYAPHYFAVNAADERMKHDLLAYLASLQPQGNFHFELANGE